MKYTFIELYRSAFPVVKMCHVLDISQSGYYDWRHREKSKRLLKRESLMEKISAIFHTTHRQMAGSPTITQDLRDIPDFSNVSLSHVALLMHEMGLKSKIQKKFTVTTNSNHKKPIASNLLDRNFVQDRPNKVVGWDLSCSLSAESTCKALTKYIRATDCVNGLMVHTDQGVQYVSDEFREILTTHNIVQSMSRRGNCWDNAVAESFFHTLKTRLIFHRKYDTKEELKRDLFWYIEIYYNRVRKHSANNWMTPEDKESRFYENKKVA